MALSLLSSCSFSFSNLSPKLSSRAMRSAICFVSV
jgi:hypothetical protein